MSSTLTLAELRKNIKNEIISILNDNLTSDKSLSDVKEIHYGDKTNLSTLKWPAVWILPAPHTPEMSGGNRVIHNFTFDFAVLTKNLDAEKGREDAEDLAARVYDVMTKDRSLNGLVIDVIPTTINPASTLAGAQQIYWSSITIQFQTQRFQ